MADVSTFEEGMQAAELGVDLIGTTLSGYTAASAKRPAPDIELVRQLASATDTPIIAEGRLNNPEDLRIAFEAGAHAAVVGSAITRPHSITQQFDTLPCVYVGSPVTNCCVITRPHLITQQFVTALPT